MWIAVFSDGSRVGCSRRQMGRGYGLGLEEKLKKKKKKGEWELEEGGDRWKRGKNSSTREKKKFMLERIHAGLAFLRLKFLHYYRFAIFFSPLFFSCSCLPQQASRIPSNLPSRAAHLSPLSAPKTSSWPILSSPREKGRKKEKKREKK